MAHADTDRLVGGHLPATFVMISQNRADAKRAALADHEWGFVQTEEQQNEKLLDLSNRILDLTQAIHQLTVTHTGAGPEDAQRGDRPSA